MYVVKSIHKTFFSTQISTTKILQNYLIYSENINTRYKFGMYISSKRFPFSCIVLFNMDISILCANIWQHFSFAITSDTYLPNCLMTLRISSLTNKRTHTHTQKHSHSSSEKTEISTFQHNSEIITWLELNFHYRFVYK